MVTVARAFYRRWSCEKDEEGDVFLVSYDATHTAINILRGKRFLEYEVAVDDKPGLISIQCREYRMTSHRHGDFYYLGSVEHSREDLDGIANSYSGSRYHMWNDNCRSFCDWFTHKLGLGKFCALLGFPVGSHHSGWGHVWYALTSITGTIVKDTALKIAFIAGIKSQASRVHKFGVPFVGGPRKIKSIRLKDVEWLA
ncbi:hypothetical protein PTSG_09153 [Salpingoeca rosetta]|uniref:Uncharacterized protein n=1 Tax=Salpingoeca rosetta (strain ATCC 50818 / BSB-021) TaxID=946362 RepID=F2UMV9_SALR5|nr:uncharacterized protein PTSG_09153 [Salpingoeca rosetta]EGD78458.1 hypothetical protein PTSG_09153 [Salpingoeca rosetta]|eukprot:XP_004989407.1 hypothetical protein PTSG_09153 [Salpingoeca rosetta]